MARRYRFIRAPMGADLVKARARGEKQAQPEEPKVHNVDSLLSSFGMMPYGSGGMWTQFHPGTGQYQPLTYAWLRDTARVSIPAAWIAVRTNQVADFVRPSQGPSTQGVVVRLRDERRAASPAAQRRAQELREIILRGGGRWGFGGAEMETRALIRDALILDQANFEVLHTRGGKPWGWVAADAATIRRARPTQTQIATGHYYPDEDQYAAVQLNSQGAVVEQFRHAQMCFGIRRPRTDVTAYGYGWPEIAEYRAGMESLINLESTNDVSITTGVHASSIITLLSRMDRPTFRMVKESLASQLLGVRNNRKTPIIQLDPANKEELKVVPLGTTNKDMEFGKWLDYRIQSFCAIVGIDRSELGIMYDANGPKSSLSTAGPEERNVASQERGLRPLLRSLASWWSHWLIEPLDGDFIVDFTGLGVMSDEDRIKHALDLVQKVKTVNEVRAEFDLQPLDSPRANLPLDQAFTQAMMAEQGGGEPGAEEGGEPFGPEGFGPEAEEAGADMGESAEDVGQAPEEGGSPDLEPLDKGGANRGGLRGTFDRLTQRLVTNADRAVADGRLVVRRYGSSGRSAVVPSSEPGVKAWIVEV